MANLSNQTDCATLIQDTMRQAGVGDPTIHAFLAAVAKVRAGDRGLLPESDLDPLPPPPRYESLPGAALNLGRALAIIKLNGGLGTSMGLDRAKSLIPVKDGASFLDFIARQVLHLRAGRSEPAFYLMNSFSTQADTRAALARHPALVVPGEPLDFLQSKVPKLDLATLAPVAWPAQPDLAWCPPGHGDLYPSLLTTGLLDRLLARGIQFLFVSNADNLGATADPRILHGFATSGLSFLMEVAERTAADRKGGHLARRRANGRLVLRESAQTPRDDEAAFQDIQRHRYFNTNNLWIRLDHLRDELHRQHGVLPLPLITNTKTVDPRNPASPRVLQLESAMGAAIECFEQSGALVVPRERFAPVKTTADLLAIRSDAYRVTPDHRLVLEDRRQGQPPVITLDPAHYRLLSDFEAAVAQATPSLVDCTELHIAGPVRFDPGVICRGRITLTNTQATPHRVPPGVHQDVTLAW